MHWWKIKNRAYSQAEGRHEMLLRYLHAQQHVVDRALDRLEDGTAVEHPGAQMSASGSSTDHRSVVSQVAV